MKSNKAHTLSIPLAEGGQSATGLLGRVTETLGLEARLARRLLNLLGDPPFTLELWDGSVIAPSHGRSVARVRIRDRGALYGLVRNPELHFGDAYATGRIEIEGNLVEFLETAYLALEDPDNDSLLWRIAGRLHRPRANNLHQARENIQHHYDLGNEFYRLWLDEEMLYTCAYYADQTMSLEAAQKAKMDHVCRKLELKPGDRVVEAGCGWGSLARHMARHYGVTVRAYNISREQVAYARERARAEGLEDRIEFVLDDYRTMDGTYDAFVSVGMLEHVGIEHYRDLGATVNRCLAPQGRGLIHTIGRNRPGMMNAWIEKRIFPGAHPPTLGEMMEIFEPWRFSVLDVENLRLHYARTLGDWLERYDGNVEEVERQYDRFFGRAWRLYLAGSIAAFTTGSLQLFQVLFSRETCNRVPLTRAHLYRNAEHDAV